MPYLNINNTTEYNKTASLTQNTSRKKTYKEQTSRQKLANCWMGNFCVCDDILCKNMMKIWLNKIWALNPKNDQTKGSVWHIDTTLAFSSKRPLFQSQWRRRIFLFHFWVMLSWIPFTLQLIHNQTKWPIHDLIHHVWFSIRLNNFIAGCKNNWTKKLQKNECQFFNQITKSSH